MARSYKAPFMVPKHALIMSVRTKQKRKEKSNNTKQDRNIQQDGALTETKGLSEQLLLEEFFEDVERFGVAYFCRERVPEGGGCDTEVSFSKGLQFGVGDGEKT